MSSEINSVVFDFGGVLIDWNRRYLYRSVFEDEQEMEWFLANVCSDEWNSLQDEGIPFSETIPALQKQFPEYSDKIVMYRSRWTEMVGGAIPKTVKILKEIQAKDYPVYGLTNWGADTFPIVLKQFEFLRSLKGIVVSGDEKLIKPDPEIFKVLINRYQLEPERSVYIDDNVFNFQTAKELGFKALHFVTPEILRKDLMALKVL